MRINTSTFKLDKPIIRFDELEQYVWKQIGTLVHSIYDEDSGMGDFIRNGKIMTRTSMLDETGMPVESISDEFHPILGYEGEMIDADSIPFLRAVYLSSIQIRFRSYMRFALKKLAADCSRLGLNVNLSTENRSFELCISITVDKEGNFLLSSFKNDFSLPFNLLISTNEPATPEEIADKIRLNTENIIQAALDIKVSPVVVNFVMKECIGVDDRDLMGVIDTERITEILTRPGKSNVRFVKA